MVNLLIYWQEKGGRAGRESIKRKLLLDYFDVRRVINAANTGSEGNIYIYIYIVYIYTEWVWNGLEKMKHKSASGSSTAISTAIIDS